MGFLSKILGVDFEAASAPVSRDPAPGPEPGAPGDGALEERIEAVLDQVRPALRADGGDIQLIEVVGNSARVRLVGACDGCPSAALTLRFGIEKKLKEAIPGFDELIPV